LEVPRAATAFGLPARLAFGWPPSPALAQSITGLFDDAGQLLGGRRGTSFRLMSIPAAAAAHRAPGCGVNLNHRRARKA